MTRKETALPGTSDDPDESIISFFVRFFMITIMFRLTQRLYTTSSRDLRNNKLTNLNASWFRGMSILMYL
jgi:hypothetical protein